MSRIVRILLALGLCLLVFFITREIYRPEAATEQVDSTVLLERIRPVLKLVTVEGDFSAADALRAMQGHVLAEAALHGAYTLNPALG